MKNDTERSPRVMVGGAESNSNLFGRAAARIQSWFGGRDQEQMNRELILRQEERKRERERIARELHDTLLQGFFGLSMQLHTAVEQIPVDSPGKPSLYRALNLMDRVIAEGRGALRGLRVSTIGQVSIEEAFASLRDEFTPSSGVRFRVFASGNPRPLREDIKEQIYMIGREALVNALRHSEATSIEAEVEYLPGRVRVVVRDNGCGIDEKMLRYGREAHWGLLGMRERAESMGAQLQIWSRPGAGTELEVSVPLHAMAEACA